jgi:CheY-like chemotaxis protein
VVLAIARGHSGHDEPECDLTEARGLRVLIVDDDEDTRMLLSDILTAAESVPACAESVAEAFELLVSFHPQVIISDIEMPSENGYAFLRNLRSVLDEDGGQTPAVALTGRALPEDRERALAAGFNLHLSKPQTPEALLRALCSVVRAARAQQNEAAPGSLG